jgi:glycosyltransferase involved in cell wall biosynthesis
MRVGELGLQGQVRLTGNYNGDINELLLSFDIYAFPSLWEGFPYSVIEAMRAGCPIIATNVGGIPEAIRNRVEGLLIPPSSVEALESAIEELMNNADLRNMLGENAKNRFLDMFTIEKMNERLQEILST